jgi:hypothetical protein
VTDDRQLLEKVYEAQLAPRELASACGMTLSEVAAWSAKPAASAALRGLRLLCDMQTQLILSRYRLHAAAKLLEIAQGEGEIARKACVDLLKLELLPAAESGEEQTPSVDPQAVCAALEQLGAEDE